MQCLHLQRGQPWVQELVCLSWASGGKVDQKLTAWLGSLCLLTSYPKMRRKKTQKNTLCLKRRVCQIEALSFVKSFQIRHICGSYLLWYSGFLGQRFVLCVCKTVHILCVHHLQVSLTRWKTLIFLERHLTFHRPSASASIIQNVCTLALLVCLTWDENVCLGRSKWLGRQLLCSLN